MPSLYFRSLPHLDRMLSSLHAKQLAKRKLSSGAKAGVGIAIAAGAVIIIILAVFLILRWRRQKHLTEIENERAKWAGEKKEEKPIPKRSKSIKDRLKGPLYQESFEMPRAGATGNGEAHWTEVDGQPLTHKPWAESSPRPSFSSKRGTRMMMMM